MVLGYLIILKVSKTCGSDRTLMKRVQTFSDAKKIPLLRLDEIGCVCARPHVCVLSKSMFVQRLKCLTVKLFSIARILSLCL